MTKNLAGVKPVVPTALNASMRAIAASANNLINCAQTANVLRRNSAQETVWTVMSKDSVSNALMDRKSMVKVDAG